MVFVLSVIKDLSVELLMDAGFYYLKCVLSISLSTCLSLYVGRGFERCQH